MNADRKADSEWLRSVVERFQAPLIRAAFRVTGNLELAREVVQDTFLRLCRQDPEKVKEQLAAWLFTVCRNRALDVMKKERRLLTAEEEEFCFLDTEGRAPDVHVGIRDQWDYVRGFIAELPEREQEALRLKFQAGLSYREIGQALGLTETNVGFILHNTLRKLRKRMQAAESDVVEGRNRLVK